VHHKECCHKIWSNNRSWAGSTKLLGIMGAGLFIDWILFQKPS